MNTINRYKIPFYIISTYILTGIGSILFYNQTVNETLPYGLLVVFRILFIPSVIAPFFVAGIMKYWEKGKDGIIELLKRFFNKKTPLKWYIIAIFLPQIVHLIASIIDNFRGIPFEKPYPYASVYMVPFIWQTFVMAGIGEEMGWRGYLQKILQKKYNSILTSIFIGAIVATWHLPLFFQEGDIHAQNSFIYFFFLMIAVSFIYTWLMDQTNSVLIVALFHTSHTIASINFNQTGLFSPLIVYGCISLGIIWFYKGEKYFQKQPR